MPANIDDLYVRHIKPLSPADRLRLVALVAQELALDEAGDQSPPSSLLELEGLGAELWQGVDAQDYVHRLRDEWEHRPWPTWTMPWPPSRRSASTRRGARACN